MASQWGSAWCRVVWSSYLSLSLDEFPSVYTYVSISSLLCSCFFCFKKSAFLLPVVVCVYQYFRFCLSGSLVPLLVIGECEEILLGRVIMKMLYVMYCTAVGLLEPRFYEGMMLSCGVWFLGDHDG